MDEDVEQEPLIENNNDNIQDAKKNLAESKQVLEEKEHLSDGENEINCSIVQNQVKHSSTGLKIKFKLENKDKTKNKNNLKHTSDKNDHNETSEIQPEKVDKLVLNRKDKLGNFKVKNIDNTVKMSEKESIVQLKDSHSIESRNKNDLTSDSSEMKTHLQNYSTKRLLNNDTPNQNIDIATVKRKLVEDPNTSKEESRANFNQKTEIIDYSTEVTPRTKRRKMFKKRCTSSVSEVKGFVDKDQRSIEQNILKIDQKSTTEPETKKKKIKHMVQEKKDKVHDDALKKLEQVPGCSKLSLEIPEDLIEVSTVVKNKSPRLSRGSDINEKSLSPQKNISPSKKLTIEDFLKELNEESKNIKYGDEITTEESEEEPYVAIKEETEQIKTPEEPENNKKMDSYSEHVNELEKEKAIEIKEENEVFCQSKHLTSEQKQLDEGKKGNYFINDSKKFETKDTKQEKSLQLDAVPGMLENQTFTSNAQTRNLVPEIDETDGIIVKRKNSRPVKKKPNVIENFPNEKNVREEESEREKGKSKIEKLEIKKEPNVCEINKTMDKSYEVKVDNKFKSTVDSEICVSNSNEDTKEQSNIDYQFSKDTTKGKGKAQEQTSDAVLISSIDVTRGPKDSINLEKITLTSLENLQNKIEPLNKSNTDLLSEPPCVLDNMSHEGTSDSSDNSDSSEDSSSSSSESSDSDSSSDSETDSDSSNSDSSDSESSKPTQPVAPVVQQKRLKIRNAPSLSQDCVHRSDSSSSFPRKDSESSNDILEKIKQLETHSPIRQGDTFSRQILFGHMNTTPTKRKRGRPRKKPLPDEFSRNETKIKTEPIEGEIKSEPLSDEPENNVVSIVNSENSAEHLLPKRRGRKPGFKPKKRGRGRKPKKYKQNKKRKHYDEYQRYKQEMLVAGDKIPTAEEIQFPVIVKRKRGRPPKKMSDESHYTDTLSRHLMQADSQLSRIVNSIPGITSADDSNEITDNRLLEEINPSLDVVTEEIVSEDVANYLKSPLDDILQFPIKKEEGDDARHFNFAHAKMKKLHWKQSKKLKTTDPDYHKKYYKYVKIPKDQQKKRGPKKRITDEEREHRKSQSLKAEKRKRGRPPKRDLGASSRLRTHNYTTDDEQDDDVSKSSRWDETLVKELENVNRSMENILTDCAEDKDFTVAHLKFEPLSEDQLKRSNRAKKFEIESFSQFDNQIDELIEMAEKEVPRSKPQYSYYQKIPKHLQKKRGRPKKIFNPDDPPRPPKPKKERPPKTKSTILVKKMVFDPETQQEIEIEVEEEVKEEAEDYIEFEEEEDEEDIDDEDKDKDFDIEDYMKKGNKTSGIDENLDYEEVYPSREKIFKQRKIMKSYRSYKAHQRFNNRFGKFGNKIRQMMPIRRFHNACDFRYVTVCDRDFNFIAKVQRMYCIKVAPATYNINSKYRPYVKLRPLSEDDVDDFFDKFWCDECEISFVDTKISKRRHEYIYHKEEVECELCERTVSNRANLKKHHEIYHEEKVYICRICEQQYRRFKSFQMHVWEEHADASRKDRAYFCNICQIVFYRRESFKFHYHEHLNGNIFAQFDTSLSDIEFLLKQLMY